ncbi:MAG: Ser-Thr-rich GPI-anchored membrane family protein [Candidatus Sigynarchaeum springense]
MTVTSPTGSPTWVIGHTYTITWTTTGTVANVSIMVYKGSTPTATVTASTHNTGSFQWTIPSTMSAGGDYKIVVEDVTHYAKNGTSATFTITNPPTEPSSVPGYDISLIVGVAIGGFAVATLMMVKSKKKGRIVSL